MASKGSKPNGSRWVIVATIGALAAGFIGIYTFTDQFAKKEDLQAILAEQQRRGIVVYGMPDKLKEFAAQIESMRVDVRRLEIAVVELRISTDRLQQQVKPKP